MKFELSTILIIVLLGWLIWFNPATASVLEGDTTSTTSTETTNVYEAPTVTGVNLCNLFQPYIIAGNTATECESTFGGVWTCQDDYVGCSGATSPIDCTSGTAMVLAIQQCSSTGATAVCTPSEIYCAY